MAVTLLRVLVLGVIAAAADDVPITWWPPSRATSTRVSLPCVIPGAERIPARRPPPPLSADDKWRPTQLYQWQKGDDELKRVQINGTVEVSRKKDGSSEGVYQCAYRHQAGLVLGYPLRLKVASLDRVFSAQPENTTAWSGQPFALSCDINSAPAATITWHRDGEPLPNTNRYYELKNQLLILNVKKQDAGLYKCKATNPYANRTRVSHGGRLLVEDYTGEELQPSLLPVNQETSIVKGKESLKLLCPVTGFPRPKLIWEFTAPDARTAELDHMEEVLTLQGQDLDLEGVYSCHVEGRSDLVKSYNVTVLLPVNITVPPTSKQAFRASTVRFNCTAVGNPPPTITWYKNGQQLVLTGRIVVRASANDGKRMELLIRSVTSADAGIYQCFARNGHSMASSWAVLNVTGADAAAPSGVACWPVGARHVAVRWPSVNDSIAYTVQVSKPNGPSYPSQPDVDNEEVITLEEPLTPHRFQVRAYILSPSTNKNVASDMSESVTCQGQGVPIKFALLDDKIIVSWEQFAQTTPDVKQWILQYKAENSSEEHSVPLEATTFNHTVTIPSATPLQIRVLGTRQIPWLHQNLSLVPWTSTLSASHDLDASGVMTAEVEKVEVSDLRPREFTVQWRCSEAEGSPVTYIYMVCFAKQDEKEQCVESRNTKIKVEGLSPATEYSVRVKARIQSRVYLTTEFTQPIHVSTPAESKEHIKDLTYKVINSTALRVSWNSVPDKYTVYYNNELKLPINQWPCVETIGNTVLITNVDLSNELYVMVSGYEPVGYSSVLHIPVQVPEAKELQYTYLSSGVQVSWRGAGTRVVRYSQNLTQSLDRWPSINVTGVTVDITGLDGSLSTYVMVMASSGHSASQVLTIPPRPPDNSSFYLSEYDRTPTGTHLNLL